MEFAAIFGDAGTFEVVQANVANQTLVAYEGMTPEEKELHVMELIRDLTLSTDLNHVSAAVALLTAQLSNPLLTRERMIKALVLRVICHYKLGEPDIGIGFIDVLAVEDIITANLLSIMCRMFTFRQRCASFSKALCGVGSSLLVLYCLYKIKPSVAGMKKLAASVQSYLGDHIELVAGNKKIGIRARFP